MRGESSMNKNGLIIPVYVNEKIVLDMLAIIEDGFSTVSQVNYTEYIEKNSSKQLEAATSTSATILSKLLKIDISGEGSKTDNAGKDTNVVKEKIHTNVSLLSKFRNFLIDKKILKTELDLSKIQVGDFIEVDGELQKNPLINYMDIFVDIFRLADIFTEEPQLGAKNQAKNQKQQENKMVKQIKSFSEELKHSGTIDFILSDKEGTLVLSAQEQYLSNDNVSEILGGHFKVLGKVIYVCKNENESIDLLRKTTLSVLSEGMLEEIFASLKNDDAQQFNLPELVTKITGPAAIVIPVAIYA